LLAFAQVSTLLSFVMAWTALRLVLAAAGVGATTAKELTTANWDKETIGKQVFVKFQAPW
jgi:hypothetical protein